MPSTELNIALLPLDIVEMDVAANLSAVERRIELLPEQTDLVVLPEMFSTGFTTDPSILVRIAENTASSPTLDALRSIAARKNVAIWGSMIARTDDGLGFINRGFMISPGAATEYYDKRHTFSLGGESKAFARGSQLSPIVEFRGWRLKMSICYDIRFPVWNRSRANDYDALIVPANWVNSRYYAWRHMLIARAIENQAYVAGCNREGSDLYGSYQRGDSLILDFNGHEIGTLSTDGTISATLQGGLLDTARARFAPWRDADPFTLNI